MHLNLSFFPLHFVFEDGVLWVCFFLMLLKSLNFYMKLPCQWWKAPADPFSPEFRTKPVKKMDGWMNEAWSPTGPSRCVGFVVQTKPGEDGWRDEIQRLFFLWISRGCSAQRFHTCGCTGGGKLGEVGVLPVLGRIEWRPASCATAALQSPGSSMSGRIWNTFRMQADLVRAKASCTAKGRKTLRLYIRRHVVIRRNSIVSAFRSVALQWCR